MRNTWLPKPSVATLAAGLLCSLIPSAQYAQVNSKTANHGGMTDVSTVATSFQGGATVVSGFALGTSLSTVNCGALPVTGGAQEASSLGESVAGVFSAGVLHATAIGQGSVAAAEASAADINVGGILFLGGVITADFALSQATVSCTSNGPVVFGQAQISGLAVAGLSVAVTGAANQMVSVLGNTVIINEQIVSQTAANANITVNALHVWTATGVELIFGSSTAGTSCGGTTNPPPSPPPPCDFLTGGGWITGTPSGARANFGVAGGIRNGALWGHLNYIDHGNGMHVKQTAVTGYNPVDGYPNCRKIDYDVTVDGQAGYTAWVIACDNGEPGRDDWFQIWVSNGYYAAGDLGGTHPGGGNIQLHKCQ